MRTESFPKHSVRTADPTGFRPTRFLRRGEGARDLVGSNFITKGVSGNRHTNSIMTNVLYDFTLGYPITPHFGFGIGAVEISDQVTLPIIGRFINDSTWQFGYQGIAGIRYNLSPVLTLDLDYRYLATTQPTLRIDALTVGGTAT